MIDGIWLIVFFFVLNFVVWPRVRQRRVIV